MKQKEQKCSLLPSVNRRYRRWPVVFVGCECAFRKWSVYIWRNKTVKRRERADTLLCTKLHLHPKPSLILSWRHVATGPTSRKSSPAYRPHLLACVLQARQLSCSHHGHHPDGGQWQPSTTSWQNFGGKSAQQSTRCLLHFCARQENLGRTNSFSFAATWMANTWKILLEGSCLSTRSKLSVY